MLLGEVAFGGLGTGFSGMIMIALGAVFLGSLMIGRTPAYLGKKITEAEAKLIAFNMILTPATVLLPSAVALTTAAGRAAITTNPGPHGLTEVIFTFASCMANNGQTMASLGADTAFYNLVTAGARIAGRLGPPALALAGRLYQPPIGVTRWGFPQRPKRDSFPGCQGRSFDGGAQFADGL